jgi:hypothetical protein
MDAPIGLASQARSWPNGDAFKGRETLVTHTGTSVSAYRRAGEIRRDPTQPDPCLVASKSQTELSHVVSALTASEGRLYDANGYFTADVAAIGD